MPKPYTPNDKLSKLARGQGFRARSVFKLAELDNKFNLFNKDMVVLDLGSAPGSWVQYVVNKLNSSVKIIAVDLKPIKKIADTVICLEHDILDLSSLNKKINNLGIYKFDIILSDLAPNTTGILYLDQKKSVELNTAVFKIAQNYLKPNSYLIMKVFQGEDLVEFIKLLKNNFNMVKLIKTQASRDRSRELYIICK